MKHKHVHKHNPKSNRPRSSPNYGPYVDYNKIKGMKFIESLRGNYPNSTFWIIGCDPNLDCYPDDFFDDKLSIALNFACIGFPDSTCFCTSHTVVANGIVNKLGIDYLKKSIFIALYREYRDPISNIWWEDYGLDPIYAKVLNKPIVEQKDADEERMIEQLANEGLFELIGGKGIINFAIQIVALLGAKRIIIVACSNKGNDIYYHAQKKGMSGFYKDKEMKSSLLERYRAGLIGAQASKKKETIMVMKLFKKHNVEFMNHRFDEERGEFVFEEIKLDE